MTEQKQRTLTWIINLALPLVISGVASFLIWAGVVRQAVASTEKVNDEQRHQIEMLNQNKVDNSTLMRIYEENKDAHKRIEAWQEMILRELLDKKK